MPSPPAIGLNVKKQRLEQSMSLDKLSRKSGVSKAMLSQIESEKVNPTIATMWKIAHALKADFNMLIKGKGKKVRKFQVNRHDDLTSLDTDSAGVHINVLSPITLAEDLELYTLTLQPDSVLNSTPHYQGTEEFLTVLSGSVKVTAGDKTTVLHEGDLINFDCDIDHAIENVTDKESMVYMVVRFSK
ncbi:MAG: helix-turn-helix domain-containing protein [Lentisphaerae bacterium]|nr:helix-turn-helix domain-containing protein [Lentisphaerota bacterium]MCP4101691.1 helix-turn-helix domain-containing protein [Lentisphaerota bacterium]